MSTTNNTYNHTNEIINNKYLLKKPIGKGSFGQVFFQY